MRLFERSVHDVLQSAAQTAIAELNRLDRNKFSDPSLGGLLDQIVERHTLKVATLDKDSLSAEGKTVERERRDYGSYGTVKVAMLDVKIPIKGNPESLRIAPSSSHMLYENVEIRGDRLILTVPDDDSVKSTVDAFVTRANENLARLKDEVDTGKSHLKKQLQAFAESRKAEIAAEDARDKGRGFPVKRS